jgi:hypothetical protein
MAAIGAIVVKCLICDEDMPPIKIEVNSHIQQSDNQLRLTLTPVFDDSWHAAVRVEHSDCTDR